jgi:hypothetical protein
MNECRVAHRIVSGSIDSLAYLGRCVPLLSCLVLSCLVLVLPLHSVAASLASRVTTTARSDHWHYMEDTIVNNNGGGMLRAKFSRQLEFVPIIAHCNTQRSFGGKLDLHISEEQSASRFWMPSDLVKPSQKFTSAVGVEHMLGIRRNIYDLAALNQVVRYVKFLQLVLSYDSSPTVPPPPVKRGFSDLHLARVEEVLSEGEASTPNRGMSSNNAVRGSRFNIKVACGSGCYVAQQGCHGGYAESSSCGQRTDAAGVLFSKKGGGGPTAEALPSEGGWIQ